MRARAARYLGVLAFTTFAAAAPSAGSVDTSPKPGGVYRLKPGVYVKKGVSCGSAPNAAIRKYDGRGISTVHTRACRARVLSRDGDRYAVAQSCADAGIGRGPRTTEQQTVIVSDALTFTLRTGGKGAEYRYCPAYALSPEGRRSSK